MTTLKKVVSSLLFWLFIGGVFLLFLFPLQLMLPATGFRAETNTAVYWSQLQTHPQPTIRWPPVDLPAPTPLPQTTPVAPQPLTTVQIEHPFLYPDGMLTVSTAEAGTEQAEWQWLDNRTDPVYFFEFSEWGINQLWHNIVIHQVNPAVVKRLRNEWIELKPGGMIAYADVNLGIKWERVGAVLLLNPDGKQFSLAGIDVDGELYRPPEEGWLADILNGLIYEGNIALREVEAVHEEYRLGVEQIFIGEDHLQVRLR